MPNLRIGYDHPTSHMTSMATHSMDMDMVKKRIHMQRSDLIHPRLADHYPPQWLYNHRPTCPNNHFIMATFSIHPESFPTLRLTQGESMGPHHPLWLGAISLRPLLSDCHSRQSKLGRKRPLLLQLVGIRGWQCGKLMGLLNLLRAPRGE